MNDMALFAGAGGGILGGHLLGWRTRCAVEIDPYARSVLLARQRDGFLPRFPIWDDVRTFDGHPWRGSIDVVSGGFPCQDISLSGKGAGIGGEKSGLWSEMARIVCEILPRFVFVENSPILTSRGLGIVLGDLAQMGYDARWCVLGAHHIAGATHQRDRIWVLAADSSRGGLVAHQRTNLSNQKQNHETQKKRRKDITDRASSSPWRKTPPELSGMDDGVADKLDRFRCLGNGQIPAVAALAWKTLMETT